MPYKPFATVTIGSTNYSGEALEGVRVTYGRDSVNDQARAGYCSIDLLDVSGAGLACSILDEVRITVKNSAGSADLLIFTGTVSDLNVSLNAAGDVTPIAIYRITAVSGLARLTMLTGGTAGYPSQFEGERIAAIIDETLNVVTWENYQSSITWSNAPGTWLDPSGLIDLIDPGTFTLSAYTAGTANSYELAKTAANSGLGQLYETTSGRLGYADAYRRLDEVTSLGFTDIPAAAVIVEGITSSQSSADIVNQVTVTYTGGEVTYEDLPSIRTYGLRSYSFDTALANSAEALILATRYVNLYKYPRRNLSELTVQLAVDELSSTVRDELIAANIGLPVRVKSLPAAVYPSDFIGFIEGWNWTLNEYTAEIVLYISDYALSVVAQRWKDVNSLEAWNTLNPTLLWLDSGEVA